MTPEEKKTLKYQMTAILTEEPVLLETAKDAGIASTTDEYVAYVAAYDALYKYVYHTLHLFDFMDANTTLPGRDLFIRRFTGYYTARDTLRDAIENGRDAAVEQAAKDYTDDAIDELQNTLTTTQWITSDILASGLQSEINDLVAASEQGFVTDEIIAKIQEIYGTSEEGMYSYVQQLQDELTAIVVDLKRSINSVVSQSSDEVDVKVQNLEKDTWAALEVKEDEILAAVGKSDDVASALSVQTDRISALVSGYNAQAYMTASIGLTWLVTKTMFEYYEDGLSSSELTEFQSRFFDVYEKIESSNSANVTGSLEYHMISSATDTQKKTLVNFLRAAESISSYIVIQGDQIVIDGDTVFVDSDGTSKTFLSGGYIKADLIDTDTLAADIAALDIIFTHKITLGGDDGEFVSDDFYNSDGTVSGTGFRLAHNGALTLRSVTSNTTEGDGARGFELLNDGTVKANRIETKYIHPSSTAAISNIHSALHVAPYLGLNLHTYTTTVGGNGSVGFTANDDGWVLVPVVAATATETSPSFTITGPSGGWSAPISFFPVAKGENFYINKTTPGGQSICVYFFSTLGTLTAL